MSKLSTLSKNCVMDKSRDTAVVGAVHTASYWLTTFLLAMLLLRFVVGSPDRLFFQHSL